MANWTEESTLSQLRITHSRLLSEATRQDIINFKDSLEERSKLSTGMKQYSETGNAPKVVVRWNQTHRETVGYAIC